MKNPFLHPDHAAVFLRLPPRCGEAEYLDTVANNVLAEYRHFLTESSEGARPVTFPTVVLEKFGDREDWLAPTACLPAPDGAEAPASPLELSELHLHAGVWRGRLVIMSHKPRMPAYDDPHDPLAEHLRITLGARWNGLPFDLAEEEADLLMDLGYIGDAMQEHAAATLLLEELDEVNKPPLLLAVADPTRRRLAAFRAPTVCARPVVVPINETQRAVLDGLRYDIEAIQGPPGTGKSTLIYHIIDNYAPTDEVTLATCVQNKAVDAIAEKLVAARAPFFVLGNEARLGLLAKEWTLAAQVERDARVPPLRELSEAADAALKRLRDRKEESGLKYFLKEQIEEAEEAQERARAHLTDTRALVCAELVESARAILCTVATASSSLLTDNIIAAARQRITTAVLDEAGTCPETKVPLLLRLPLLKRIVAIGDHKQLQPFTHWRPAAASRGGRGPGVCHFFNGRAGSCRRGAACPFSHSLSPGASSRGAGGGLIVSRTAAKSRTAEDVGMGAEPQGFFQRLRAALPEGAVGSLLDQYRMHASIAEFVSDTFYDATLRTPPAVAAARAAACAHGLWWLAYPEAEAEGARAGSRSYVNDVEVAAVLAVARPLARGGARSVMVITFYRDQEAALRRGLAAAGLGERLGTDALRVMTVDQAQGSEADVVILSCVRSNARRALGFVADANRMNVAISRARERLVVVGDAATLCADAKWAHLRGCCRVVAHAGDLPAMPLAG